MNKVEKEENCDKYSMEWTAEQLNRIPHEESLFLNLFSFKKVFEKKLIFFFRFRFYL